AELPQEELEQVSGEAEACSEKQKKLAAASQAAAELLEEKQEVLRRQMKKLRETLESTAMRMQNPNSASGTDSAVTDWSEAAAEPYFERTIARASDWAERQNPALFFEQSLLERKQTVYNTVRRSLSLVDGERQKLREKVETAKAVLTETKANLEGSRQKRKTLDASGLFASKEEAEHSLSDAKSACKKQETLSRRATAAAKSAKEEIDRISALIRKYEQELPGQEQFALDRREAYKLCMKEKNLSEEEWQELTRSHAPEEETRLREQIELYTQRKTAAESRAAAAKETIGDRPKPEPEGLKAELQEAERRTNEAQEQFARIGEISRADERTYLALASKQSERSRAIEEHTRLDTLYRLISGNVKDSRMDLETFVQRYYMERILHAANRRFLEMSGGQFELRMVDAQMAGKGKNRGLDLLGYSTVTGKAREIRTLSGGESFMAALSLALGMADQIQQSTASIHLDMMFIDEGFGSLDDHSRNQAVRVLQEMAGSDRLIGIISHVTELKQEIDDQLVVTRDETGSHVRWQIS
ncbi:MAG: DNA repair protein, partial [Lachnospiraceae bacterium]|nr:DNA repair protein [Lachnospiraceae bacterium]